MKGVECAPSTKAILESRFCIKRRRLAPRSSALGEAGPLRGRRLLDVGEINVAGTVQLKSKASIVKRSVAMVTAKVRG